MFKQILSYSFSLFTMIMNIYELWHTQKNTYTAQNNLLFQQMTQEFCNTTEPFISTFRQYRNQELHQQFVLAKMSQIYNTALLKEFHYNRHSIRSLRGYIYNNRIQNISIVSYCAINCTTNSLTKSKCKK